MISINVRAVSDWALQCVSLCKQYFWKAVGQSLWRFFFFNVDHFKVFIEFVTTLLRFYVSVFLAMWPWDMWDLSSPTRDQICTPFIGRQSLSHWTTREVPVRSIILNLSSSFWWWWSYHSSFLPTSKCSSLGIISLKKKSLFHWSFFFSVNKWFRNWRR